MKKNYDAEILTTLALMRQGARVFGRKTSNRAHLHTPYPYSSIARGEVPDRDEVHKYYTTRTVSDRILDQMKLEGLLTEGDPDKKYHSDVELTELGWDAAPRRI